MFGRFCTEYRFLQSVYVRSYDSYFPATIQLFQGIFLRLAKVSFSSPESKYCPETKSNIQYSRFIKVEGAAMKRYPKV